VLQTFAQSLYICVAFINSSLLLESSLEATHKAAEAIPNVTREAERASRQRPLLFLESTLSPHGASAPFSSRRGRVSNGERALRGLGSSIGPLLWTFHGEGWDSVIFIPTEVSFIFEVSWKKHRPKNVTEETTVSPLVLIADALVTLPWGVTFSL